MLTATEAAQALGVSKRHLYQLAAAKKIACYRFGSAVRFDPQDIEAYKQSCRSPATTLDAGIKEQDLYCRNEPTGVKLPHSFPEWWLASDGLQAFE